MTLVEQAAIFLLTAVIVVPIFRRLQLGAVLGYLAAGAIIGPWGLGLIADADATLNFAEIGVVLLLFLIGLELEPSRLWALRHPVFGLGGAQVAVTGIVLTGIAIWLGPLVAGSDRCRAGACHVLHGHRPGMAGGARPDQQSERARRVRDPAVPGRRRDSAHRAAAVAQPGSDRPRRADGYSRRKASRRSCLSSPSADSWFVRY